MNLIERVKNILMTPKTEWEVIKTETATTGSLFISYVLPLALLSSAGSIIKSFLFVGPVVSLGYTVATAVVVFIVSIASFYLSVLIVDMLAPSFSSEKDSGKTAQLIAYSGTPSNIAGFLSFIPILGWVLPFAAWAYGIYLMYLGLGPLKNTPEDKKIVYMIISYVIIIAIYFILFAILMGIVAAVFIGVTGGIGGIRNY